MTPQQIEIALQGGGSQQESCMKRDACNKALWLLLSLWKAHLRKIDAEIKLNSVYGEYDDFRKSEARLDSVRKEINMEISLANDDIADSLIKLESTKIEDL